MATKIRNGKEYPDVRWGSYLYRVGNRVFMKGLFHPGGVPTSGSASNWYEVEYDENGEIKKPFGEGYSTKDKVKAACGIEFPEWQKKKISSRKRRKKTIK